MQPSVTKCNQVLPIAPEEDQDYHDNQDDQDDGSQWIPMDPNGLQ